MLLGKSLGLAPDLLASIINTSVRLAFPFFTPSLLHSILFFSFLPLRRLSFSPALTPTSLPPSLFLTTLLTLASLQHTDRSLLVLRVEQPGSRRDADDTNSSRPRLFRRVPLKTDGERCVSFFFRLPPPPLTPSLAVSTPPPSLPLSADLNLALSAAQSSPSGAPVPLPLGQLTTTLYSKLSKHEGFGGRDFSVIYEYLEEAREGLRKKKAEEGAGEKGE